MLGSKRLGQQHPLRQQQLEAAVATRMILLSVCRSSRSSSGSTSNCRSASSQCLLTPKKKALTEKAVAELLRLPAAAAPKQVSATPRPTKPAASTAQTLQSEKSSNSESIDRGSSSNRSANVSSRSVSNGSRWNNSIDSNSDKKHQHKY
ncbi:hypothetical protein, conserved [Eimeria tenella]|uniref:Uncharacterized protein n=1 Tax=Eimeria tenella TaxID=5802 RepID=U6KRI6_EIMTE|nr:hypothetical protein, conserved [Eimeria tenella]CDJ38954.1 hypothetical protein, conserved [Eimeria tenella]|eukprot:XP_013229709.1 hypothetical protein, conserved [Eimeria tenella]